MQSNCVAVVMLNTIWHSSRNLE